jgi:Flp pilus assembly protein TadG
MNIIRGRNGKRAQSLVIIALSATVLFGIIALGMDAGRLYFQRRDVQNAADSGALAGAQELIPNSPNSLGGNPAAARCQAVVYALKTWGDTPNHDCSAGNLSGFWNVTTVTETASNDTAPKITVTAPWKPNEIKVDAIYTVPTTFAAILGFTKADVAASAVAHGGFYNKVYTIFGFDSTGSGNSVNYDQNGYAQVDNGRNGTDCQVPDPTMGKMVSNAKFHVPNPNLQYMNLNGDFQYAQASDTHALIVYWQNPVTPTTAIPDPAPGYAQPDRPSTAMSWSGPVGGPVVFSPGYYNGTINIPLPGHGPNEKYIFRNGVYWFDNGGLNITGGYVSNTSTGLPVYDRNGWGYSDLGNGPDGRTNGVEFVFDGNSTFNASGTPQIFFVAPNHTASGTDSISFFILGPIPNVQSGNTTTGPNGQVWTEAVDGIHGGQFQDWGTVFNADTNGSHGTVVVVTGVDSVGGQNPTPGGQPLRYAIEGELISPQVDIDGGGLATNGSFTNSTCTGSNGAGYRQNPAALIVQFNPNFAPHFRGYSYLVK